MSPHDYVDLARRALGLPARVLPPVLRQRLLPDGRWHEQLITARYPDPERDEAIHARLCAASALAWADVLDADGLLCRAADLRAASARWSRYAAALSLVGGES